jgi:hypothetical protein
MRYHSSARAGLALSLVLALVGACCCTSTTPGVSTSPGLRKTAAIGTFTNLDQKTYAIELLATTTATNSPPSGASAGLATSSILDYFGSIPDPMTLLLESTAGSGTMTVTAKLWGYTPLDGGTWVPLGTGGDTTKGIINAGAAIGETTSDRILHAEPFQLTGSFQRYYLEITAIGGTSTAVKAYLLARRAGY